MYIHPEKYIPEKTVYCYKHTSQGCYKPCKFHKHTVIFPKYAGREDLSEEQLEAIRNGDDLIIDGEKWELVDEFYRDTIDGDRVDTYIFKRPSDNRFFRINLFYLDGDDYREHLQDNYAYEVKKVVENIVIEKWVDLKLRKEFKTFFLRPI